MLLDTEMNVNPLDQFSEYKHLKTASELCIDISIFSAQVTLLLRYFHDCKVIVPKASLTWIAIWLVQQGAEEICIMYDLLKSIKWKNFFHHSSW